MSNETDESIAMEYSSIDQLTKDGFKHLVEGIKNSNGIPSGSNWDFHSTDETFSKIANQEGSRILGLMNRILRHHGIGDSLNNRGIDEKVELIVEANDQILDRVANLLDEYNGIKKNPQEVVELQTVSVQLPVSGSWNQMDKNNVTISSSGNLPEETGKTFVHLVGGKNIIRPQQFFKDTIENSNSRPWQPRITEKPNSIKPLALYVENTSRGDIYSHPYEIELEKFKPLESTLTTCEPVKVKSLHETPLVEVGTESALQLMLKDLLGYNEIAVDLEHHSYRTFMGITCLMQISTKDKDYLVDTLALRDKLWVLNEVFTKPSVVKIFHGADQDILWLQRDLSLYIVNMFDTHQAAILLSYPRHSLSYLLTKFFNVTANKRFQLADWRIRPLPHELKQYAREDTHYLINIYHQLRNELIKKENGDNNLVQAVFKRSVELCEKRYEKPMCTEDSHLDFYRKHKRSFDNRQVFALKALYNWRDSMARNEDESTGYVLPNHMLLQICEALPREMQGIFACCNPVPPLLRANALEIHTVILNARKQPVEKAIMKEDNRAKGSTTKISKINFDSPLNCPHDLTQSREFRANLSTLLTQTKSDVHEKLKKLSIEKLKTTYSVFDSPENSDKEEDTVKDSVKNLKFLGPYERYKLVKPFIQAEEERKAKEAEEKMEKEKNKVETDDPSSEDRIAALHKHFIDLKEAKKTEVAPIKKSLVEMGGGRKKRKRDDSPGNVINFQQGQIENNDFPQSSNNLHSTLPNQACSGNFKRPKNDEELLNYGQNQGGQNKQNNKKGKKWKKNQNQQEQNRNEQQTVQSPQHSNRGRNQSIRGQNMSNRGNRSNREQNQRNRDQNLRVKHQNNRNQSQGDTGDEGHNSRDYYSHAQEKFAKNKTRGRGGKSRNNNRNNRNDEGQQGTSHQQETFQPFDYSAVDYKQFQGGSSNNSGNNRNQVRSDHRGRGKNKSFRGKHNTNKSRSFNGPSARGQRSNKK